jgi:hypothetical protein
MCRREVDPLHLTSGERPRLAVEGEIAQPHIGKIAEAAANLGQQQVRGLIERLGKLELVEELARPLDRQQHQIVNGQSGQRSQRCLAPLNAMGAESLLGLQRRVRKLARADAP